MSRFICSLIVALSFVSSASAANLTGIRFWKHDQVAGKTAFVTTYTAVPAELEVIRGASMTVSLAKIDNNKAELLNVTALSEEDFEAIFGVKNAMHAAQSRVIWVSNTQGPPNLNSIRFESTLTNTETWMLSTFRKVPPLVGSDYAGVLKPVVVSQNQVLKSGKFVDTKTSNVIDTLLEIEFEAKGGNVRYTKSLTSADDVEPNGTLK